MGLFSGLGDMIFGKDKEVETVSTLLPKQTKAFDEYFDQYTPEIGVGATPFEGPGRAALDRALGSAPSSQITPELSEKYFRDVIEGPARRQFQENVVPSIREQYASKNSLFGSGYQRAMTGAQQKLTSDLMAQLADIQYRDRATDIDLRERQANRQFQAVRPEFDEQRRTGQKTDPDVSEILLRLIGQPATNTIVTDPTPGALGSIMQSLAMSDLFGSGSGTPDAGLGSIFGSGDGGSSGGLGGSGGGLLDLNLGGSGGIPGTGNTEENTGDAIRIAIALAQLCWVAEEIWGVNHPQVWAARAWCVTSRNWFTKSYRRYGIKWAAAVRRHPFLRVLVRPVWSFIAMRGRQIMNRRGIQNGNS